MTRGCVSDTDVAKQTCDSLGTTGCRLCDASVDSGCNAMAAMVAPSLACIQCTGSGTDAECGWGFPATKATPCTAMIPFTSTEQCYTSKVGDAVVRGCSLEATQCSGTSCSYCAGAGCNGDNVVTQSCIKCRTDMVDEEYCREVVSSEHSGVCKANDLLEYADRGCYTRNDGKYLLVQLKVRDA